MHAHLEGSRPLHIGQPTDGHVVLHRWQYILQSHIRQRKPPHRHCS